MNVAKLTTLPPIEFGYVLDPARPVIPLALEVRQATCHAPHRHPRGQLLYAGAGVMQVICDSGRWVVPPSQAVWLPPDVEHIVHFPGEASLRNLFVDPSAVEGLPQVCAVLQVAALLRELILKAVSIGGEYDADGPAWRLMQVVLDELRQAEQARLHLPTAHDARVLRVMDALLENPGDDRPVEGWARVACASSRTLARLFVQETGMTFGAWRQQLRLLEAIDRLGAGQSVTQVAFDLGYESLSAFIEMFRKSVGVPPGKYFRSEIHSQCERADHEKPDRGSAVAGDMPCGARRR